MTSVQSLQKNNLYRSYCPIPSHPLNQIRNIKYSIINIGESINNHNKYKYERIDNMFKLVEVRSNNSDPKEQEVHEEDRIDRLNQNIQELTNRIISLQLQQAKLPGLQKKLNDVISMNKQMDHNYNYISEKISAANQETIEIKERLEEVEEQESFYERGIGDIMKLMREVKEESSHTRQIDENRTKNLVEELRKQVNQDIIKLSNAISNLPQVNKLLEPNQFGNKLSRQKTYRATYREAYQIQGSVYSVNTVTYRIDCEGRLLDQSGFIILDKANRQIRLNESHLKKLYDFGLLY